MAQGSLDPRPVLGDLPGELDEGWDLTPPGPGQPAIEDRDSGGAPGAEDEPELLLEQVRPVERLVRRRDPGELRLLALGQVLRVLR